VEIAVHYAPATAGVQRALAAASLRHGRLEVGLYVLLHTITVSAQQIARVVRMTRQRRATSERGTREPAAVRFECLQRCGSAAASDTGAVGCDVFLSASPFFLS